MTTYKYRCLPPGCIRLLRLSPHQDDSAPIRCQLFEYSLASARRKGTHLYEALSYCWGSPTKSQTIITDAGLLQVTENLHAALIRLRDPALERIIWIDAICINQDDLDEKGLQVQLMAEIYARASCVIVWLENVTGNHLIDSESEAGGRQALRVVEAAASRTTKARLDNEQETPPENEQGRLAVEKVLGRPWFSRIWVLQEVAAARHVLIMCKSAEIDGQAFYSGLSQMSGSLRLTEDARSRIRSVVNLIKGATLRPKGMVDPSGQFSLQISPLGNLIEMHYIREATDRRDKIYALLGMSTDKPSGLVPTYQMSWKDLFPHLVKSLLPESSSVTTIDEHEAALIKIRGCVIGTVVSVRSENTWDGQQLVNVTQHKSDGNTDPPTCTSCLHGILHLCSYDWPLQATPKRICRGDVICLLQGTSFPTIVRVYRDYCSIVAIAVDTDADVTPITAWRSNTQVEFLLTWSWKEETHPNHLDDFLIDRGLSPMACITLQTKDDLNTVVMLLEAEQYYSAALQFHSVILASEDFGEGQRPNAMAVARLLDVIQEVFRKRVGRGTFDTLRNLIGKKRGYFSVTEDTLIELASAPGWLPMAFFLETQGKPVTISENILTAAVKNGNDRINIIKVLLDNRNDQTIVTEKCLNAALEIHWPPDRTRTFELFLDSQAIQISHIENFLITLAGDDSIGSDDPYGVMRLGGDSYSLMKLLLDERKGDQIAITENVLTAAAAAANKMTKIRDRKVMMELLLAQRANQITITENVLVAAAGNKGNGDYIMKLLFQWKQGCFTITEKVLAAAARNKKFRSCILDCLFVRGSNQSTVTNQVLKTVYQNLSDSKGRAALHLEMEKRGIC